MGVVVNAGTGNVVFRIKDGAGNTNNTSGNITTRTINAGTFLADNTGTGDNIINGAITTSAAGNNLVMSTGGNINNLFGAGALNTGIGRFLLYGADPATSSLNGITSAFTRYANTYTSNPPVSIVTPGNGLLWASADPTGGAGVAPILITPLPPVIITPTNPQPMPIVPSPIISSPEMTPANSILSSSVPVLTFNVTQEIAALLIGDVVIDALQETDNVFSSKPTTVRRSAPQPSMTGCVFSDNGKQSNCLISIGGNTI